MMKIKALTLSLLATTFLLNGCANGNKNDIPPMPVDVNPSTALKFARAMNLRLITDYPDGQYVIFNEDTGKSIRPLKEPVVVGKRGEVKSSGNGTADVIAGLISHSTLIPALSVLTSRSPSPFTDGLTRVATWGGGDANANSLTISKLMKKKLPHFYGFADSAYCKDGIGYASPVISKFDPTQFPKPPINTSSSAQIIITSACLNALAQKKENEENMVEFSAELGEQWAVFVPGSPSNEPKVYNAGKEYRFIK
ncbi:hypothetical protein [Xenorhabdus sp. KJ12.1]|uniref:hypothetical protein n=1 Tax=Xenorhabdus sp. KJ12.1 TaxID=1851571 RepID=UPI000C061BF8|nr:hypothetical protein [Xenorhabdus sp. KJ12.1]PHM72219.1 hypothetical protein Xekj_00497 [Xenorhabdus sp. KJ12.1]